VTVLGAVIRWSLDNRALVVVAFVIFCLFGVESVTRLPIDAVPDLTNVQVQIITAAPALPPLEVEQYVTVPVERAMSGIPNVSEIRSLSKYGISVVTVVFTDETSIYLARQLVGERLSDAAQAVPSSYGKPEMGPISTGLGEIYQFVLRGPGYSLMQLEEILDWYIAPQLRSVPGITEVNSMGGEDRQYQVVLDPTRLQAAGLSIQEVAKALELTNANAGGGYIERNREQYVIGTNGLVKSLADLRNVVVGVTPQGIPIIISNVGEVRFGPRLRRGAASMDGRGEAVVGVAMMLMGQNSRTVTEAVKQKIATLQPTLPRGVRIEPFYDRSVLVNRTIHTVAKNLSEGAILVILVLLLLLGDLRAGLLVASTIPLAMLFAIVMMNATGTSGNLMSLGAIDFGLIVDAAVIIVENSVRRLNQERQRNGEFLAGEERINIVHDAAVEVLIASVFGEAIIAIVYVPILTLSGIEGKLFHPMALVVLFALTGAFIASLTIVPVLASYLLVPKEVAGETRLMQRIHARYVPMLDWVLIHRAATIGTGTVVLMSAVLIFSLLGAEFVPQLDEGDLLIEVRRLPGVSLLESVAMDGRIQRALAHTPEVTRVVSRTGAAEIPTDPMGIEQTDTYVELKPREQWRRGLTKGKLANEIDRAVEREVPEASIAVSQPIQMRTNELIAGARSDVALEIYGSDLDLLQQLAEQAGELVRGVQGVVDVRVEQGSGLTYLRIIPDRAKLARYGLTVDDLNTLTETMAVGRTVGVVFEGDRRFDLTIKIGSLVDLDSFKALPLKASTGQMVPLGDVATVAVFKGPALINHSELSRRRLVEFNVRGRDLVSTVKDAQSIIAQKLKLPEAYRIEWGGEFEHFTTARARLMVVVPIALALILFMLWTAFGAMKPALLIFLNVPFAAIGGVYSLWLRSIPFSISAGVGFVALFGVAVLNGLVLLSFCRQRESLGLSPAEAIREAAQIRLRPVLMTALVASLGFIPMALSTSPGSEVQRPLATVVIGGVISATALTLFLFPVIYTLASSRSGHARTE
jgi:cobalt-zinc-cadmium resistance protein CzcA